MAFRDPVNARVQRPTRSSFPRSALERTHWTLCVLVATRSVSIEEGVVVYPVKDVEFPIVAGHSVAGLLGTDHGVFGDYRCLARESAW